MNSIIIFCAKYLFVAVVIAIAYVWLKANRDNKIQLIIGTIIAGVLALLLSRIAGHLYYDPRPFVKDHVKPLIAHAADNGFPSDHALLTGTLTAIVFFFNRKVAWVMVVLTVIVGIARVLAKVHSPLDIAGGWIIGSACAVAAYYLVARYIDKKLKVAAHPAKQVQKP